MTSTDVNVLGPPDQDACQVLADALGDTPETVISTHLLRRGMCWAYIAGDPSAFDAAIVQAHSLPTEPVCFGSDPEILWELLQSVRGWDCILVDSACASGMGERIKHESGIGVRYLDDVCHTLTRQAATFYDAAVRQLTRSDLELLESAPRRLRDACWESPAELLSQGIVACAIVSGEIVATALTSARSDRYAEVGVYTREAFRRRGLASAAASIVVNGVQEAGQIPVWSAGAANSASLRIAQKLGFREMSRRTYVILAERKYGRSA